MINTYVTRRDRDCKRQGFVCEVDSYESVLGSMKLHLLANDEELTSRGLGDKNHGFEVCDHVARKSDRTCAKEANLIAPIETMLPNLRGHGPRS